MAKKKAAGRTKSRKLKLLVKFVTIVAMSAIASVSVLGFMSYSQYQEMKEKVETDRIYNNIYVNGLYIGGLTKDQAYDKLFNSLQKELDEKTIVLKADDKSLELKLKDFEARYNFTDAIDTAYKYAKEGNIKERFDKISALENTPLNIEHELGYTYNADLIIDYITPLEKEVYIEPIDATVSRQNGEMTFTDGHSGRRMNMDATAEKINNYLEQKLDGQIDAVLEDISPRFTREDLQNVKDLIGEFSTKFSAGDNGRNQNIINALSKINNVVLYPGEVFSTNHLFGAMTYDNGYRLAPEIVNGKLQDGYGGGVCQVSSTLYNAVLFAELEVVERVNHSMKVAYTDYGFDATLAGNYIDFKFRNSTPYPLIIEGFTQNGNTCIVKIYGYEEHAKSRRIVFSNELVSTIEPSPEIIIEDPNLPLGERVVITAAKKGYKYSVYKSIYDGDAFISKEFVASSTYRAIRGEVQVGTKVEDKQITTNKEPNYPSIYEPIMPDNSSSP